MELEKKRIAAQKKLLEKGIEFQKQVRKTIVTAVTTAFALVIALFWQDAIKTGIESITAFLGLSGETYIYKIITAVIVTIICVFAIMYLSRWQEKK